jgi:hypothetical protein
MRERANSPRRRGDTEIRAEKKEMEKNLSEGVLRDFLCVSAPPR